MPKLDIKNTQLWEAVNMLSTIKSRSGAGTDIPIRFTQDELMDVWELLMNGVTTHSAALDGRDDALLVERMRQFPDFEKGSLGDVDKFRDFCDKLYVEIVEPSLDIDIPPIAEYFEGPDLSL